MGELVANPKAVSEAISELNNNIGNKQDDLSLTNIIADPNTVNKNCYSIVSNSASMPDTGDYHLVTFVTTIDTYQFGVQFAVKRSTNVTYTRSKWGSDSFNTNWVQLS